MEQIVVLEIATDWTKGGYSGDDLPKTCFRSLVGKKGDRNLFGDPTIMFGATEDTEIQCPFTEDGSINNLENYTKLWKEAVEQKLKLSAKETPVFLIEDTFRDKKDREKITEACFEEIGHPSMFISKSQMLSVFSQEKTNGIVVDCGASSVRIVPVYNGRVLSGLAEKNIELGGNRVNKEVEILVEKTLGFIPPPILHKKRTISFLDQARKSIYNEIKEETLFVKNGNSLEETIPNKHFEFCDGTEVVFENAWEIPEIFFSNQNNIISMFSEVLKKTPPQIHNSLLSNVLICGGSSLIPGFVNRINFELQTQFPGIKIKETKTLERRFCSWMGGSILSSLPDFKHLWITKQEYQETGPFCVEKRDF